MSVLDWFSDIEKDKVLHDDMCCTISLLAACICRLTFSKEWRTIMACAFFVGVIFAIGKELYDEWKYKGADERDWKADICGIVRGTLFSVLLTI